MSFDLPQDDDVHHECRTEIAALTAEIAEAEKRAEARFIEGLETAAGIAMGFRGHLASHVYDAIRLDIAKAKMISDNAAKEIRND